MWYDPIFLVETVDGRNVWCKRHYRVRSDVLPGTFRMYDIDNGIVSDEFWTISGVAHDLGWVFLHYAGAADAVGQRYLGGLLCTPNGELPDDRTLPADWRAAEAAGIRPWELHVVNNNPASPSYQAAGEPPLDYFLGDTKTKMGLKDRQRLI